MRLYSLNLNQNNYDDPAQWPNAQFDVTRLWDTGDKWADIETSPGVFNFARLDSHIRLAISKGVKEVIYCAGMVPAFYGGGTLGANPPTDNSKFTAFVSKTAQHIRSTFPSLVLDWEQWNEPNQKNYWTGTPEQLLALNRAAYAVLHPMGIRVLSPSGSGGTAIGNWILAYLTACARNYPFEVFAYHAYLGDGNPDPSHGMDLILGNIAFKKASLGITGPTWFTEGSWKKVTDYNPPLNAVQQPSYLKTMYDKMQAAGVEVFCWYAWDNIHGFGVLAEGNPPVANSAGLMFISLTRGGPPVVQKFSIQPPPVKPPVIQVQPDDVTPPPEEVSIVDDTSKRNLVITQNGAIFTITDGVL